MRASGWCGATSATRRLSRGSSRPARSTASSTSRRSPGCVRVSSGPRVYADVNVHGTAAVLEAATRAGRPRIVFASSSSVYGERQGGPFREDDPVLHPISPYAATKRAGELLAHAFHHSQGLSVTCARIFTAYGPRQRPDLAVRKFAERMLRGEPDSGVWRRRQPARLHLRRRPRRRAGARARPRSRLRDPELRRGPHGDACSRW